jgi:hypothetical protein
MAVVLFTRVPELSLDRYDRMMVELGLDANPPAGVILHIATEAAGGVNVCEVWQTQQSADSFVERRLGEALTRQGVKEPLSYRIEPLHNLFAADMDIIDRIGATSVPMGQVSRALAS